MKLDDIVIKVGDLVEKPKGYRWPGIVRSIFETGAGRTRYVVESISMETVGALHIYSGNQIRKVDVIMQECNNSEGEIPMSIPEKCRDCNGVGKISNNAADVYECDCNNGYRIYSD